MCNELTIDFLMVMNVNKIIYNHCYLADSASRIELNHHHEVRFKLTVYSLVFNEYCSMYRFNVTLIEL